MTVAVTGANGFVGAAIVDALRRCRRPVRALVRDAPAGSAQDVVGIGDLTQPLALAAALKDVESIVHCAGLAHRLPGAHGQDRVHAVNVAATIALAEQAARAGVRRFVFISSAKVMGEHSGERPLSERDPPAPADAYARSKLDAEAGLHTVAAQLGLDLIVLRPPLVYGPGVRANFLRLLALCDSPWPLPLGAADAPRSLIAAVNLADATLACLDATLPGCHTFFVADQEVLTSVALIARLRRLLDRPRRLPAVPLWLLRPGATLAGRRSDLERLTRPFVVQTQALRDAVGWHAPVPVDAALAETVAGWRRSPASARLRR